MTQEGMTPAHIAAQKGHVGVIVELARGGAKFDVADKDGRLPVHIASLYGQVEVLKELEKHGVKFDTEDNNGRTPAHYAAAGGSVEVISFFATKDPVLIEKRDKKGLTLAHRAALTGKVRVIPILLELGVDLNAVTNTGHTPAYAAAGMGHAEFITELAKHVDSIDNPATPLAHAAAFNGHLNVLQELSRLGVQLDAPGKLGVIPLFLAAQNGHAAVVRYLLDQPHLQNKPYISTAVSLAAFASKHSEDIQYKMNILIHSSNQDPEHIAVTPEQIAYIMGNEEVIKELRSKVDINYMQLLSKLSKKQKDLTLRGEHKAAKAASELQQKLTTSILQYYSGPANQQKYDDFKASCTLAIAEARPTLEKHRTWKDFLAILTTAVLSLGLVNIGLAIAHHYKTGRFSFRMFKTESVRLVEDVEEHINKSDMNISMP